MSRAAFLFFLLAAVCGAISPPTDGKEKTRTSVHLEETAHRPIIRNSFAVIGHHGTAALQGTPASTELLSTAVNGSADAADGHSSAVNNTAARPSLMGSSWEPAAPSAVPMPRPSMFDGAAFSMWMITGAVTISLMVFDFVVLQRFTPDAGFTQHVCVLSFWVIIGLCFNVMVYHRRGKHAAMEWTTGYLLEWMLSMDNLFVFHLVFRAFNTPRRVQHKSLFVGILGAALFRMMFFISVSYVLSTISWIHYVFGFFLVYSGIQALISADDEPDVANLWIVRFLQWALGDRLLQRYDLEGCNLFVSEGGKWCATLLVPVAACLELVDIVFAADSVGAKVSQIPDTFIAYTSSLLAMFGLRSLFFIIEDMVEEFELLKYGLCFILVFIGAELIFSNWVHLPTALVFGVISVVFLVCIVGSMLRATVLKKQLPDRPTEPGEAQQEPARQEPAQASATQEEPAAIMQES